MADMEERARELASRDWTIEVTPTARGGFFARVLELRGCMTEADSWDELQEMVRDSLVNWLAVALEHGDPIPEPMAGLRYSGRILVRISPSLHRGVAAAAQREGVSMNQWVTERLAAAAGDQPISRGG